MKKLIVGYSNCILLIILMMEMLLLLNVVCIIGVIFVVYVVMEEIYIYVATSRAVTEPFVATV